jgi:glycine oxidase
MKAPDVLVIGGGVIGASVAYHLAREGVEVTLLERAEVASQASGAAAGMLLPLGEAGEKGPFLFWGLRSLAAFPDLARELHEGSGIDPEYEPSGALHVARGEARRERLRSRARDLPDVGAVWLDAGELRRRVPGVAQEVVGALWSPAESHVRSPQLVRAYLVAAARLGARVETGVEARALIRVGERVVGVDTAGGPRSAGQVVLCAGAWSPQILAAGLPIEPVRGQIVSLEGSGPAQAMLVDEDVYLVPKRDGRLVVGATEERVGFENRVTAEGVACLLDRAFALVPELARRNFAGAWSGLRPATPDGLPAIGPVPGAPGLFLAAGHHRNGVLLSPITGERVAAWVRGGSPPDDAAAFDPARFGCWS